MQAWVYRPSATGGRPSGEVTPIVVKGVMYLTVGNRVVALEPETGKEIWRYELQSGQASQRGVAYWPGDREHPPRILFTAGRRLIGLNAITGEASNGFGNNGEVDMVVGYGGVPTIYKNVAMVGGSANTFRLGRQAIRVASMFGMGENFGTFIRCRIQEKSSTKPGKARVGRSAPA
jgi:glucose dehydrogenase